MNDQEILNIAKLARLDLKENEIEKLKKNFLEIRNYIDLISEVKDAGESHDLPDTDKVVFHEDEAETSEHINPSDFSNYSEDGYFKVPKVIE